MLITHFRLHTTFKSAQLNNVRNLWTYVARAFNLVDSARLQQVGPDRLCAEWVLKNSGAVAFTIAPGQYLRDYNALPPENIRLQVKEIDATDATIMKVGFDHLKGCKKVDKIILHRCKHLEDGGLEGLAYATEPLRHLEVINCPNLTDNCLMALKCLKNLEYLKIANMQFVKNIQNVKSELSKALPNCKVDIS